MKKMAIILIFITLLSKFLGLGREISLSYLYGASNISDAYLISVTIPGFLLSFIGVGIYTGFIPVYSEIEKKYGLENANRFTSNLINIVILVCTLLIMIGLYLLEPIVKLFASGFDIETLKITVEFTRVSIFVIYFTGIMYVLTGYLQIKGNYVIPAITGLFMNIFIIVTIYISTKTDILFLTIGYVGAVGLQFLLLLPFLKKYGFKYKPIISFKDKHIKKMGLLVLSLSIGVSVNQFNLLIDRSIASTIVAGGISVLNYAVRINDIITGLFVATMAVITYPIFSNMIAENDIPGFKKTLKESINIVNMLVLPATIGLMVFAEPVVRLLFGRGEFDEKAILMTSNALLFYSVGMIGMSLREIFSRAFFSMQDTKTPVVNATIGVVLNIILNFILSRYLGLGGLALATSISAIFTAILLFFSLRKKMDLTEEIQQASSVFIKILMASVMMGIIAKGIFIYLSQTLNEGLSLLATILISSCIYFLIIYFMKIEDARVIIYLIKQKFGKKVSD